MIFIYSTLACLENNFVFNAFLRRVFFKTTQAANAFKEWRRVHSHGHIQSLDSFKDSNQCFQFYSKVVYLFEWLMRSYQFRVNSTSVNIKMATACFVLRKLREKNKFSLCLLWSKFLVQDLFLKLSKLSVLKDTNLSRRSFAKDLNP